MKSSKTKINEDYVTSEAHQIEENDVDQTLNRTKSILQKLKNSKWKPFKEDVLLLIEMLKAYKNKEYSTVPWKSISAITFTLLYIINPFDIVPDFIPFVGYVDDISVLGFCLNLVRSDLEAFKAWKN